MVPAAIGAPSSVAETCDGSYVRSVTVHPSVTGALKMAPAVRGLPFAVIVTTGALLSTRNDSLTVVDQPT